MKLRAIVIDDDENCRSVLSLLLERQGYEVISLPDPCACPLYRNSDCLCPHEHACGDLLIADNQMPRMTGLEFIEHQSKRGCKGIVSNKLVLSGTWSSAEIDKAQQLGCKVLHKPYDLGLLMDWVQERAANIPLGRKLTGADAFGGVF